MLAAILIVLACSDPNDQGPPPGMLEHIGDFSSPVFLTAPPGDSARVFIVEQEGRIVIRRHDTTLTRPLLDIRGRITFGGEQGLLSLAFDPGFATNRRFFVYFVRNGDLRIVRYTAAASDPDSADESTADTILKIAHPGQSNHNGGQLQFGPDGKLWIGTGDGGGGGDPDGNGQDKHALLGKLLRLEYYGREALLPERSVHQPRPAPVRRVPAQRGGLLGQRRLRVSRRGDPEHGGEVPLRRLLQWQGVELRLSERDGDRRVRAAAPRGRRQLLRRRRARRALYPPARRSGL